MSADVLRRVGDCCRSGRAGRLPAPAASAGGKAAARAARRQRGRYVLCADGRRCPFLCADGLCELQRTLGEQSLCRTCRDFPRWEVLLCDRVEQGLSPACPEAARRLLERSAPLRFVSAPLPDDGYVPGVRERRLTAAVTAVRDRVLALLARPGHTAYENLAAARAFACAAQRLLDRHRIAALAAGDVPGVTAMQRRSPCCRRR